MSPSNVTDLVRIDGLKVTALAVAASEQMNVQPKTKSMARASSSG